MASTHVQEIEQLNRLYSALTRISQAIVRTQHRDQLVSSVCKILVEQGGFGMAWIGWHDPATRRLVPLAQAGDPASLKWGLSGFYASVIQAGVIRPGDDIRLVA